MGERGDAGGERGGEKSREWGRGEERVRKWEVEV